MGSRSWSLLRGGVLGLALAGCVERGEGGDSEAVGGSTSGATDAGSNGTSTTDDSLGHSTTTGATTSEPMTTGAVETTGAGTDGGSSSAGGDDSTGSSGSTTGEELALGFEADVWPIVAPNCGCHFDGEGGALKLGKMVAYQNLVGQPSVQVPKMLRVAPGAAEDSYLWHKLNNTHKSVGGTGKRMPPGGALEPAEIELVAQWIDEGAAP